MSKSNSIWKQADSFLAMTRKILVNGVTAIVLIAITFTFLGGIFASFGDSEEVSAENKVLWFKPIGVVVDSEVYGSNNISIEDLLNGGSEAKQYELQDLLDVLGAAATDDDLSAVYINVSELGMYWASAFKIAEAVKNIRDSGKRVIAYAEGYGNNAYLISSQANEVLVNEYGGVDAFGFSRKREYYVDLYKNIKLNYNVFTAGDFKSGPEPYTRDSMSENDKIAWNAFAVPMWKKMTSMMEEGRQLPEGTIQNYGDNVHIMLTEEPEPAQVALNLGLVDMVVTREEIRNYMFEEFPNNEEDIYAFPDSISIDEYLSILESDTNKSPNKIAVVNIEGAIMTGEAALNVAGSDTIVKNIQSATKDEDVKAMVLRVNSPGGDVWASELITNALNEFKNTGRPIVASMGDVAASGGVWVTTNSDEIWAEEDTLTGSIGVYGIVPTMDGLYDWAGIKVDGVSSTKAGEWDPREAMPGYMKDIIQSSIDNTYKKFVTKVAENRGMAYVDVLPIAGGRIWSGVKALELGLVDKIGDLEDALISAANMADIEDYSVKTYKKEADPLDLFLQEILKNIDYQVKVDPSLKILLEKSSKYSKIINPEEENIMAYCFECDAIENL
ncbi:signal peptide peptidase SppA [Gammaproteobacteria bacterium]|nr:signal peptide peptidase SppA [Gammaproteobacteria bacterium]MDA9024434.1 signal peptide peptidase SppA [Gammaproteobacteria bacterium]MDA9045063.1 signal peptide peptidase SppA [Gammaproteobacteria bacterium]